ncbi:MAG: CarD family transcriptional regulator [Defluviitaleaceae bacterium]|nr:CarD family transcriptional regulator [Defluviitaleaceae bacterium]
MFSVGDKIVYPMHGAGIVHNIQEKEVDGQILTYYVLTIPIGSLTVTISNKKADDLGIRYAKTQEEIQEILDCFNKMPQGIPDDWNKKYESNLEKMKTGELSQALEVYLSLYSREGVKGLSGIEKRLLSVAKQVILSELIVSQDIDKAVAEKTLRNIVAKFETAILNL